MSAKKILLNLPRDAQDHLAENFSKGRGTRITRTSTPAIEESRWGYFPPNPKKYSDWGDRFVWLPTSPVPIMELAITIHPKATTWRISAFDAELLTGASETHYDVMVMTSGTDPMQLALECLEVAYKERENYERERDSTAPVQTGGQSLDAVQ